MKKIVIAFLICIALLSSTMLAKTASFTSRQIEAAPFLTIKVDKQSAALHLSRAIQFKTISSQDSTKFNSTEFTAFHQFLEKIFENLPQLIGIANFLSP